MWSAEDSGISVDRGSEHATCHACCRLVSSYQQNRNRCRVLAATPGRSLLTQETAYNLYYLLQLGTGAGVSCNAYHGGSVAPSRPRSLYADRSAGAALQHMQRPMSHMAGRIHSQRAVCLGPAAPSWCWPRQQHQQPPGGPPWHQGPASTGTAHAAAGCQLEQLV
jgi:hypothetical protein